MGRSAVSLVILAFGAELIVLSGAEVGSRVEGFTDNILTGTVVIRVKGNGWRPESVDRRHLTSGLQRQAPPTAPPAKR